MTTENPLSSRPVYDPVLTRRMGVEASLAYDPRLGGGRTEIVNVIYELRVVVTVTPAEIILAIRGTKNLRNWLTDINARMKALDSQVKLHAGFLNAADALLPEIIAALLPLTTSGPTDKATLPPIRLTGHSLGGALATAVAFALAREGFRVASVHTFASPRVGNHAWRTVYHALLGDITWRVCAAGDAIPLLPGLLAGYRHVGQEVFLRDGTVTLNPSRLFEIASDSWDAYWAVKQADWAFLLKQHSMDNDYLAQLQ